MTVVNLSSWWDFLASVNAPPNDPSPAETFANNEDIKKRVLAHLTQDPTGSESTDAELVERIVFLSLDEYRAEVGEELYSAVRSTATFTVSWEAGACLTRLREAVERLRLRV